MEYYKWIPVRDVSLLLGTSLATIIGLLQTTVGPLGACLGGFVVGHIVFLLLCRFRTSEPDWKVDQSRRDQL